VLLARADYQCAVRGGGAVSEEYVISLLPS
jgi:hypothetical protein